MKRALTLTRKNYILPGKRIKDYQNIKSKMEEIEVAFVHSLSLLQHNFITALFFYLLDGLTDCMDPDCCIQSPCQNSPLCRGSRDPLQVIQQSPLSQPRVRSFYDRVKMLVGRESTHMLPGENPFNSRYARKTHKHRLQLVYP